MLFAQGVADLPVRSEQEEEAAAEGDPSLFFVPLGRDNSLFTDLTRYNLNFVRYSPRGYDPHHTSHAIGGVELSGSDNYDITYLLSTIFRPEYNNNIIGKTASGYLGRYQYNLPDGARTRSATLYGSTRNYRYGANITIGSSSKSERFTYHIHILRRWGRDASVSGVFTDQTSLSLLLSQRIGEKGKLSFLVVVSPTVKGMRSYSYKEAFALAGDNLYNASWGYIGGREFNSKTRGSFRPLLISSYDMAVGKRSTLKISAAYNFGHSYRTSLGWYGGQNPYPDYYRVLPSFFAYGETADVAEESWRTNDTNVTQIDWSELKRQNSVSEELVYLIEKRISEFSNLDGAIAFSSKHSSSFTSHYKLKASHHRKRSYMLVGDLLGGRAFADIDRYLDRDSFDEGQFLNDTKNPDRRIAEGDKFGYNYDVATFIVAAAAGFKVVKKRFSAEASAEIGALSLRRIGHYQKGSVGNGHDTFGSSRKIDYTPYSLNAAATLHVSPRQWVSLAGLFGRRAPKSDDILLSPEYKNIFSSHTDHEKIASAELNYGITLDIFRVRFSAFTTKISDRVKIYSHYDDIEGYFAQMAISSLDELRYGTEIGLSVDVSNNLRLDVAGSVGSFTYSSDPLADSFADSDSNIFAQNQRVAIKGFRIGNMPQTVASCELTYMRRGWIVAANVNYAGDRYIDIAPLRRTERVLNRVTSPEGRAAMVTQEKLPSAMTLNFRLRKQIRTRMGDFAIMIVVNNLLGDKDIVYGGYEQMRVLAMGESATATRVPLASKYLYSQGRSFYLSLNYRF